MTEKLKLFEDLLKLYSSKFHIIDGKLSGLTACLPFPNDDEITKAKKEFKATLLSVHHNTTTTKIYDELTNFNFIKSSIINIKFDTKNIFNYSIVNKPLPFIRFPDNSDYRYMYKTAHYQDISPLYMLKRLYHLHKISKVEFKTAIKRIKAGKPPKEHIEGLFNCFLKGIKSPQGKNSIIALKRKENKREHIKLYALNNPYKVGIKSRFKGHLNHIEKFPLIEREFKIKFQQDNNIPFIDY